MSIYTKLPDLSQWLPRAQYTVVDDKLNEYYYKTLNDDQKKLLEKFIDLIKHDFPEDSMDIFFLIRVLKARKWKVENAEKMFRNRMKWINFYKPHQMTEKDLWVGAKFGCGFVYGTDKQGRHNLYVCQGRYVAKDVHNKDDTYKFFLYLNEVAECLLRMQEPGNNLINVIYDIRDMTLSGLDISTAMKLNSLGDYYPEICHKMYVIGSGWFLTVLFKVAKTIMDPVTFSKINILDKVESIAFKELLQDFSEANLLPNFGGTGPCDVGYYFPSIIASHLIYNPSMLHKKPLVNAANSAGLHKEEDHDEAHLKAVEKEIHDHVNSNEYQKPMHHHD